MTEIQGQDPDAEIAPHPLDAAVSLDPTGEGRWSGVMSPAYWNMAAPFGGIIAATLLRGVLDHPERRGRPLSQTVNFCAAITAEPFELTVTLTRDGRSTQHWNAEILQDGAVGASATLVTGPTRESWAHQPADAPDMPPPESLLVADIAGRRGWFGRYQMRFERGAPMGGGGTPETPAPGLTRAWLRDEPPRPLDYVALASLADAFAPRVFLMRGVPGPAATVTLSTYFLADEAALTAQGDRPILGVAEARAVRHGFHDQSAELWSDDGVLLAVSHQLVWFKA